ncbi:hypothetical protein, partial [Mycoplasmopsis felifaucium]|uniref:hypothetical protein n=1 Tax=Mycoplasmopsis felifaucium TaxID=35768 RepID=UPI000487D148
NTINSKLGDFTNDKYEQEKNAINANISRLQQFDNTIKPVFEGQNVKITDGAFEFYNPADNNIFKIEAGGIAIRVANTWQKLNMNTWANLFRFANTYLQNSSSLPQSQASRVNVSYDWDLIQSGTTSNVQQVTIPTNDTQGLYVLWIKVTLYNGKTFTGQLFNINKNDADYQNTFVMSAPSTGWDSSSYGTQLQLMHVTYSDDVFKIRYTGKVYDNETQSSPRSIDYKLYKMVLRTS